MKTFSLEAEAALAAGDAVAHGAVRIGAAPNIIRFWGGHGVLTIDGEAYLGIGHRGLVSVSGGSLGGAEAGTEIVLSGVDPDIAGRLNLKAIRGQPVVIYRLFFNGTGARLLHAAVYQRGRVDRAPRQETPGGTSTIRIAVEGAARGLGRRSERMRTDSDQRLISASDGGLRRIGHAAEKQIYLGGKPPQRAGQAFGGVSPAAGVFLNLFTRGAYTP